MTEIKKCEATIRELERKRAACVKRGTELADERAAVALDAHTGNTKARKRLDEINAAIATHGSELASLDAAIKAAGDRLAAAQEADRQADQRRVAMEVRGLLKSLRDAGKMCDEALETFAAGSNVMKEIIQRMNALGFNHPSGTQYMSLGERAVRGMLVNSPFARAFETIAPRERQNFNEFVSRWCVSLAREIAARLGETKQTEAA